MVAGEGVQVETLEQSLGEEVHGYFHAAWKTFIALIYQKTGQQA